MLFEIDSVKFGLFLIKFPVKGFNLIAIELGGGGGCFLSARFRQRKQRAMLDLNSPGS